MASPPRLKSGVTQIPPYSRGWWLMAVDLHPFRGLAPIPRVGTHGCVMSPLRGSIWCVALPWVTLRSTHGWDISPLCGSMWLPCNNYALCIMNYALKKAHGWDPITANAVPCGISAYRGFRSHRWRSLHTTAKFLLPLMRFRVVLGF